MSFGPRPHIFSVIILALPVLLSISCGEASPPGPARVAFDSAGIQVVEFDLDRLEALGTIEASPDWVFGEPYGSDSDPPLNSVMDAKLMSDGRVVVAASQPWEILVADPAGGGWERIADAGPGPGGVDFIKSISIDGEIIGVHDSREWLTYSATGFLGREPIPRVGVQGPFYPDFAISDGGGFIVGDAYAPPGSPGGVVIRREVLVAHAEDGRIDTIAIIPGETGIDKFTGVSPLPFGPSFGMEKGETGVWLGDSSLPKVALWSRTGELEKIVRWSSTQDRRLTRRRINAYRDHMTKDRPSEIQANIRRNFRETAFPSEVPAWGTMVRGSDGNLWIGGYPGPAATGPFADSLPAQLWWGVDASGHPIGTLVSPPGLKVTDFATDFIIGIHRDSLQVETIRCHRILERRNSSAIR